MSLENLGIPTVVVCTGPFKESALLHARTLGRTGFLPIIIPHPLGGLDPLRVSQRANEVEDQVVAALCSDP